jgi:hypothetical protein
MTSSRRRLLVLVGVGLLACGAVCLFTTDFTPPLSRGVVGVQLLQPRDKSQTFKLRLTNTDKKSVEVIGVLVEEGGNGEWFEKTNITFRTNLAVQAGTDIVVPYLATNQIYRARVSYFRETTGLRLAQKRMKQMLRGRWESGKSLHWTEGVSDELRPQ